MEPATTTKGMEPSGRQETESGETPQGAVVVGESGFTDVQLAAIGRVVQELLEKALSIGASQRLAVGVDRHRSTATERVVRHD